MKKVLISIFTLIFIISMITVVNAATGSISVTPSANQVVKGGTFTVTVAGTAEENITALQSALSFDTTKLSLENKSAGAGFTDASGSNSEIAILSTDNSSLSKSGTLYTLTFKVLDTAVEGETKISITNATLALVNNSQTQENVNVSDVSATVTIKADTTTVDQDNNKENTQDTNKDNSTSEKENTPSNNKNTTSTNSTKSTTSSSSKKTKLPQTGAEVGSVIAIAILSVIAVISYVSYKKYKNI